MSIFKRPDVNAGLTTQQKAAIARQMIISGVIGSMEQAKVSHKRLLEFVWQNPYEFTAQQVLSGLGENAGKLIGKRTWGGLVKSSTHYRFIDGGSMTAPDNAELTDSMPAVLCPLWAHLIHFYK